MANLENSGQESNKPKRTRTRSQTVKKITPKEPNTLKVEIISHRSLLEILGDWKHSFKIMGSILILVLFIFLGMIAIVITVKKIYPYSNIKTNLYGATTVENEETEVIYWLFNTAELWSNSGIKVNEGDILTIRASGKSHTAIHHLVEEAKDNKELTDKWVGTDGGEKRIINPEEKRDILRMKYRIFANKPQDALLMQVVTEDIDFSTKIDSVFESYLRFDYITPPSKFDIQEHRKNFYFIGKERINLRINQRGILHFAVNDIVLTRPIIDAMIKENNDSIRDRDWKEYNKKYFKFGPYPDSLKTLTQDKNEMHYYKDNNYYNAWIEDNVGSFLIIVERRKGK